MQGIERTFDQIDINNDGVITSDEWAQANAINNANGFGPHTGQDSSISNNAEVSRGVN